MDTFIYHLDLRYEIRRCSSNWDDFARENGGSGVLRSSVIGTNLIDWIADEATREFYLTVFERVAYDRDDVVFGFECNAPAERRRFRCRVGWLPNGFMVQNTLIVREPYAVRIDFRYRCSHDAIAKCSICNRYRVHDAWRPHGEIFQSGLEGPLEVRYQVCPRCRSALAASVPA